MSFYTGNLSKLIANEIKKYGGIIDENDLASYKTIKRTPVEYNINSETKLYTAGPPFSGNLLAFMLNIIKTYNLTRNDFNNSFNSAKTYHKLIETMKFSFSLRNFYSDPNFSKINLEQVKININLYKIVFKKNFINKFYKHD